MKTIQPPLLGIILASCAMLLLVSCSTVDLNNNSTDNNSAVARLYIGLSSSKLYREILVEEVEEIISRHFKAATVQESTGFYEGEKERSLIITIINCCRWKEPEEGFREKINNLASQLKNDLGQESILVEYISQGHSEIFEVLE